MNPFQIGEILNNNWIYSSDIGVIHCKLGKRTVPQLKIGGTETMK